MPRPPDVSLPYELTGASPQVHEAVAQVARAAADDRGVLIAAERGLDAQAVARVIHAGSTRSRAPLIVISCEGAGAELDRLLFGGPHRASGPELELLTPASALVRAHGGAIFLENVNELPAASQRRLARVLRDREVRLPKRTGSVPVDVRVIASTEDSLNGSLRDELVRRLPVGVDIPALRLRRDDVPAIAEAMLSARGGDRRFTPAALTVLSALPWRRNTAELARLIERLTSGSAAALLRQEDVLAEVQLDRAASRPSGNLRDARRQFERDYIASVLREHAWQMRDAARALGIERANLYRKARQLGIPLRRESDGRGPRMTNNRF